MNSAGVESTTGRSPRPTRVEFTSFAASVSRVERLGGSFVRVTLAGDELADFHAAGLDQRVKLVFPLDEGGHSTFPRGAVDWYSAWRALPENTRCPLRTYTVRAARPADNEIDIDFAVHGDSGPGTRWAGQAEIGQELIVIGPDARTLVAGDTPVGGVEFRPGGARRILLAGDETAAPAICCILESLPEDARGQAFIEVATARDAVLLAAPAGVTITWLPRDERPSLANGEPLQRAVRAWVSEMVAPDSPSEGHPPVDVDSDSEVLWEVPDSGNSCGDLYAWIAGEAGCITELRRFLVRDAGLDRADVAFMGYWRAGRSEN